MNAEDGTKQFRRFSVPLLIYEFTNAMSSVFSYWLVLHNKEKIPMRLPQFILGASPRKDRDNTLPSLQISAETSRARLLLKGQVSKECRVEWNTF